MDVKLCDFGDSQIISDGENALNNKIVSKAYRSPELFLGNKHFTQKIDIWGLGCVIIEFFLQRPLFNSNNSKDILENIIRTVSEIGTNDLEFIEDLNAISYIESIPRDDHGELAPLLSGKFASKEGRI